VNRDATSAIHVAIASVGDSVIIKLTEEFNLFSWLETEGEHEWYSRDENHIPLGLVIISTHHAQQFSNQWYKDNMGNSLWFYYK